MSRPREMDELKESIKEVFYELFLNAKETGVCFVMLFLNIGLVLMQALYCVTLFPFVVLERYLTIRWHKRHHIYY